MSSEYSVVDRYPSGIEISKTHREHVAAGRGHKARRDLRRGEMDGIERGTRMFRSQSIYVEVERKSHETLFARCFILVSPPPPFIVQLNV
jgi:hypothetical protein